MARDALQQDERRRRARPDAGRAHRPRLACRRRRLAAARLCDEELRDLLAARVVPLVPADAAVPASRHRSACSSGCARCSYRRATRAAPSSSARRRWRSSSHARCINGPSSGLKLRCVFIDESLRRPADRRRDERGDPQNRRRRDSQGRLRQRVRQRAPHRRRLHRERDARAGRSRDVRRAARYDVVGVLDPGRLALRLDASASRRRRRHPRHRALRVAAAGQAAAR